MITGLAASSSTTAQSTGTSPNPTVFSGSSSTAFTGTSTPTSSSNAGAIAGGVIGGIAFISIAALAVFYFLRRQRRKTPSVTYPVDGVPQPQMEEFQQPLSDDGTGTYVPPSAPGTPVTPMKLYVCVFVPWLYLCMNFFFRTLRTRMTRLRSLGTNRVGPGQMSLPHHLGHRTTPELEPETPWHQGHQGIMVCPLFDFMMRDPFELVTVCSRLRARVVQGRARIFYVMTTGESHHSPVLTTHQDIL